MNEAINEEPEFLWNLQVWKVRENGREFFEFLLNEDEELIAEGSSNGLFSIVDQALEAVVSHGLTPNLGNSPSITDLAFSTGVLVERIRLTKELEEASHPEGKLLELSREELDAILYRGVEANK
jgi:hypothetical protein